MTKNMNSLEGIVTRLRERGIHAELCRRTKTVAREKEALSYETDKNLAITVYIKNNRKGNDSSYAEYQSH